MDPGQTASKGAICQLQSDQGPQCLKITDHYCVKAGWFVSEPLWSSIKGIQSLLLIY